MFKECIYAQRNLQYHGCWNRLERLGEMFLNTFHRDKSFVKRRSKKLSRENSSKNITDGVCLFFVYLVLWFIHMYLDSNALAFVPRLLIE